MKTQTISQNLNQQAIEKIHACILTASDHFNTSFPVPELSYRLRGKAAGKACLQQWQIRLNPVLFQENQTAFIEQVIPHEIAHLLTFRLYGHKIRPHGKEWQNVMMSVFHLAPETTHQFNISSVRGRTFEYQCRCRQHQLTIRRHNRVQREQANYRCSQCHQLLVYTGKQHA